MTDQGPLTLGTAGHIDHGKTALIRALTGVDTDRLPEEQTRGISIALGYAPLQTSVGRSMSVVDVPGHERFVRTMVAGATGIDLFLMVIAADDGVMPQTVEHALILKVLDITHGIVALSKSDLIDPDPAMGEARELFPSCELVGCSAETGEGLEALRAAIDRLAARVPSRAAVDRGVVLHVDRAFTIVGRGTVVTGTLWSGRVARGDKLMLLPSQRDVRVRGLQVHSQQVEYADAGQRVAMNLSGVHFDEVHRGDTIAEPGVLHPTSILDCRLEMPRATHNMSVLVHHGTRYSPGRLVLLADDLWQVRLERPLLATEGDRLVIRRPAPADTLGGGVILEAHAERHGPRPEIIHRLRDPTAPLPDGLSRAEPQVEPVGAGSPAERLRELPAVDQLADAVLGASAAEGGPTPVEAAVAARAILAKRRAQLQAGQEDDVDLVARAQEWLKPSLRRVLNGTGVVLHTNLGRAPLANSAAEAIDALARGYTNLELDLQTGQRGSRDDHLTELLCDLTGAEDALAVNNGAAAVLLAVVALAGADQSIAVSRGQLVEIGGGFRIPDVIAQAGARLIEVGATNRTRPEDYQHALEAGAKFILRVHQSNFRTVGYTQDVDIETLCQLGAPVIDDLGSGILTDQLDLLADEPPVRRSVHAGAALVCFSGDKLIGGPQAGIILGTRTAVGACRQHPLIRALRIGRLPLAGLQATLSLYRDPQRALREIPILAMLDIDQERLQGRAESLAGETGGEVIQAVARVGGGALPLLELTGPAVALNYHADPHQLARALREANPPLLTRIHNNHVVVDPRTLPGKALTVAASVIRHVFDNTCPSIGGDRTDDR
jgi:L-seryl-tRNA(Sec) selenium transferase